MYRKNGRQRAALALSRIRSFAEQPVLIGYMRVSKADGSQTLDLQSDTLVAWKLDRLGRDLRHLVNLVHDITRREIGRPSSPRWELDIVAYSGRDNLFLVVESKSRCKGRSKFRPLHRHRMQTSEHR